MDICPYCKHQADFEVHPEGFKVCKNCCYVVCMPACKGHVYTETTEYPGKQIEQKGLTEF